MRTIDVAYGRRPTLKLPCPIIHNDHTPRGGVLATPLLQDQTYFYQGDGKAQRPHGVLARFLVWRPHRHSRAIWGSASGAASFTRMGAPGGQRSCPRGPLSPECLRQRLAWSRCSASVCKMNEWHRMASYQQVGTRSQIPRSSALGLSSRAGSSAL